MEQSQNQDPNQGKLLAVLFLGLAILLVGLVFYSDGNPVSENPASPGQRPPLDAQARRQQLEKAVNAHIQLTNRKIEIDKEKIDQEARFTIPQVGQLLIQPNRGSKDPIDMRGDRNEMNPVRDLRRGQIESRSAEDLIHREMAEKEERDRQNAEYMKEYARQFVENARANGYEVELSSDYRVLNVRKVNPTSGSDTGLGTGPAFR